MKKHLDILSKKYSDLTESDLISFNDIAAKKNVRGVYIVYSPEKEIIYIGSTNKFHVRFGTDLKHETQRTQLQRAIDHAEKKIDELVYGLYGLTPKEIELVEKSI
ncbi:MAG: hypothetical protein FVQ77_10445 [Cytophagales bacterium]|nr:hypothetical protein [Cytophagales bacterium]